VLLPCLEPLVVLHHFVGRHGIPASSSGLGAAASCSAFRIGLA
jgi:hypothetical protein